MVELDTETFCTMQRRAARARAKGELDSILEYFPSSPLPPTDPRFIEDERKFHELEDKIKEFIKYMEEESPIS